MTEVKVTVLNGLEARKRSHTTDLCASTVAFRSIYNNCPTTGNSPVIRSASRFFFTFYFTVLLAFRSPLPFVSVWLIKLRNRCRSNFGMAMFNSLTKRELSKLSTNFF